MLNKQLTKKQAEILDYIKKFSQKNNYSPALSKIAEHFKVSIPTIHQHIEYLKKKGYLKTQKGIKHSIQTTHQNNNNDDLIKVPVLGTIFIADNDQTTLKKLYRGKNGVRICLLTKKEFLNRIKSTSGTIKNKYKKIMI
jgi:DNA-binding transcriptional regulator YhcF (GntR family)